LSLYNSNNVMLKLMCGQKRPILRCREQRFLTDRSTEADTRTHGIGQGIPSVSYIEGCGLCFGFGALTVVSFNREHGTKYPENRVTRSCATTVHWHSDGRPAGSDHLENVEEISESESAHFSARENW
jgi:hypothetical protein